jgi:hypothetical protein
MAKRPATKRPTRKSKVRALRPVSTQPSVWERVPTRFQHGLALGLLLIVTVAFWWPVTFGGMTIVGGDTIQWRGMAEAMFQYEEETDNRALWAPNGFAGMPGYLIHYPKEVPQIDTFVAVLRNLGWWPGAHFLMMLLGAYLAVFYLSRDVLASTLGAIAYGFTTYVPIILTAGHNTKFVALAFAPWLVLAFIYALRRPPGAGWLRLAAGALLFAVALAANLRAEHVQITYYVVFALGVVWLVEGFGSVREGQWRQFLLATGALALGGMLAMLMVAHPYMAVAEYKAFTIRGATAEGGLNWEYAMRWSQGFGEIITLLIPGAYGGDGSTYWGPKPFTAGPHYVGPIVLILAVVALSGVKRRIVTGFGIAAALMVLFSFGEHLPFVNRPMFTLFPLFDAFRVPETWLSIVALALAILAGAGSYYLGRREATPEAVDGKTKQVFGTVLAVGGLVLILLIGRDVFFSFEARGEVEQIAAAIAAQSGVSPDDPRVGQAAVSYVGELKSERRGMFTADAARALVFILLGGLLLALQRTRRIPAWSLQVGLILLVLVDVWQVDRRYFDSDHPSLRSTAEIERAIPQYGVDRFVQSQVQVAGGPGHFRTFPLALNPFNDGRSPYFYESIGGYHGAKLALFQDYIDDLLFSSDGRLDERALDLLGTRFVITRGPVDGWETAFEDQQTGLFVMERPDAAPRAWFVEDHVVAADREATYAALRDPRVDLRTTAILAEPLPFPLAVAPIDTNSVADVSLIRYTPREIVWQVETDRERLFVASEVYYPAGWVARIDERDAEIHRANHLLRSVVVPPGRHHLSMRFDPPVHRTSLLIASTSSTIVYLLLALLIGLMWYRRGAHS